MATYAAWRNIAEEGRSRRVTYVCGVERVLVEEVITVTRDWVSPGPLDYVRVDMTEHTEMDLWNVLNQHPALRDDPRLVIARGVERIKNWQPFLAWMNDKSLSTYAVLVSKDAKLDTELDYQSLIQGRGWLVQCSKPNSKDTLAWVMGRSQCSPAVAELLVERCEGDFAKMSSTLAKLALFKGVPSTANVDALCRESAGSDFVEALESGDRARAMAALETLPVTDYGRVIGVLIYDLTVLSQLYVLVRAGRNGKQIAMGMAGTSVYLVNRLKRYAKDYDPGRISRTRQALMVIDDAMRDEHGVPVGAECAMEALVALW